jgi:hypothetical protein
MVVLTRGLKKSNILDINSSENSLLGFKTGFPIVKDYIILSSNNNPDKVLIDDNLYSYDPKYSGFKIPTEYGDSLKKHGAIEFTNYNFENWTFTKLCDNFYIFKPPGELEINGDTIKYDYLDIDYSYVVGYVDKKLIIVLEEFTNPLDFNEIHRGWLVNGKQRKLIIDTFYNK